MLFRRLFAGLFMLGLMASLTLPVLAEDKDKGKDKDKKDQKDDKKDKKEDAPKGDAVTLKWKFEKDKVFYQTMTTKTKQSMKVMNNDVNQTQNQTFYFKWRPTKVEGDKVTIDQEIA